MVSFTIIKGKLEAFIRRYYINELIKGSIFFLSLGLIYLLVTLFLEYMLWLSTTWRALLFWSFVIVETLLFSKFIILPLSQLFKLRKGIGFAEASEIIGNHFPEVGDKLLNVLQLNDADNKSELLLASIEQKSKAIQFVPFKSVVKYQSNIKYSKYLVVPVLIIVLTFITGNQDWFSVSYNRVVDYKTAYKPPAPFEFFVLNSSLEAIENTPYVLEVKTIGDVVPSAMEIHFNNEVYFMQPMGNGQFQFVFSQPTTTINFELKANQVLSIPYSLNVLKTPGIESLEMDLNYPAYTGKVNERIKSSGNAIIPEGTEITWIVSTKSTSKVNIYAKDTISFKESSENRFSAVKKVTSNLNYDLVSSNENLPEYERLSYALKVIKDGYPELEVEQKLDSLDQESLYFLGAASDDYAIKSVNLVYYKTNDFKNESRIALDISKGNYTEFISAFPGNLNLEPGVAYELYFEARDNDALHGFKVTKSPRFSFRKRTLEEQQALKLEQQNKTIKQMDDTFKKLEDQDKKLEELSKTQKEKEALNFNDRKKFEAFLKRQKQQEDLMKNFNKNLQKNLDEFKKEENDPFKEQLKERLKDNEEQLLKDEELLKELEELQDKISKEEFSEKLDELAKRNQNKKRSMKQLLELTKRFYVTKKAEKVQKELEELARKQVEISNESEKNTEANQDKLNKDFKEIRKELESLKKDNSALQKPLAVPQDKITEERIEKDQKGASELLNESENSKMEEPPSLSKAQQKQKAAAKKMQKMSENLKKMQQGGGGAGGAEQIQEDAEMLRQILDNLVLFSFDEETLMNQFKDIDIDNNQYGKYIVDQNVLRTHFEHVDDSLFALSLRQPKLSENVNKQISNVYYNIDKALDQLSENRLYQGVSYQQYSITAANELASFLSDMLDNLESQLNMMPSPGSGGEQLQDIIISQEELQRQFEEGVKKSEEGAEGKEDGDSEDGKQPGLNQKGEEGKLGEQGNTGKEGNEKEGSSGEDSDGQAKKGKGSKGNAKGDKGGEKDGNGEGDDGQGEKTGYGEGGSEEMNKELYDIYRKQQQLRQALENKVTGQNGEDQQEIKNLIEKMEEVELDMINKGFTAETMNKMMDLQHQLLKLDNASFQQGRESKRESKTNYKSYQNNTFSILKAKSYFNRTESLNRQSLPFKDAYKKKVQSYFKSSND